MGAKQQSFWAEQAEKWPSVWVARTEARDFTGGAISEKHLANLDSAGEGPKGRIRCGRKILYPVKPFVEWLENRSTLVRGKGKRVAG